VGATQQTTHPRCLKLVLAFEVGQTEGKLSGSAVNGREALPIIHLLREVLGCKDGSQVYHHKFDIGDGHASLLHLLLSILHHDDELGDANHLNVVLGHVQAERDHVNGMQPPAVGIKVGHDFKGLDLCVESLGILQVIEPNLVNNIVEKFCGATFSCFVSGVVGEAGFVGSLSMNTDGPGIVNNVPVIEGKVGRPDKLGGTMVSFVLGGLCEDGYERMDS
jgi:hypothetical protein